MERLYESLEERLESVVLGESNLLRQSEKCITETLRFITQLKEFVIGHTFADRQGEITFFKETKPKFSAKLIYHNGVFNIEMHKPVGSNQVQENYLNRELGKLNEFFDANVDFYRYYRTNATYLDEKYFLRGTHDIHLALDSFVFDADPRFSTSQDHKVAKIIANERLVVYLKAALAELEARKAEEITGGQRTNLNWTLSKTSCIELLYALHSVGAFGKVDVKQIATYFESAFNIDLKNYYRTFLEIRIRKTGRASFLDLLRERLIQRMDDADENAR